jgi:hypothetical protein
MPVSLNAEDRKVLIVSGALLVLLTVASYLSAPSPVKRPCGFPSSYCTANDGGKAAYLLLEQLGYRVQRWDRYPSELPEHPSGITLILGAPSMGISLEAREELEQFISRGGRVLATERGGADLLPGRHELTPFQNKSDPGTFRALLPGPVTRQAPEITLRPQGRWKAPGMACLFYYGDAEGPVVVAYPWGEGQVEWWADSEPLTNSGLTEASNLELFLNSLGPPRETRILWDEYFHGQRPSLLLYLGKTPAPWFAFQCLVLLAALLLTFGRRSGPIRPLAVESSRLSPLEFIETLGDLYSRKRAAPEAFEIAYGRFRFLLLKRLGLPSNSVPEKIWSGVHDRLGWLDPDFYTLLRKCERALRTRSVNEAEALRFVRELHYFERRWRL